MTIRIPVAQHCGPNAGPRPFMGSVSQDATASALNVRRCTWVLPFAKAPRLWMRAASAFDVLVHFTFPTQRLSALVTNVSRFPFSLSSWTKRHSLFHSTQLPCCSVTHTDLTYVIVRVPRIA